MNLPGPEEAIVDAALEKPRATRGAYLDEVCNGDTCLRQLVEGLLRAHENALAPRAPSAGSAGNQELPRQIRIEQAGDHIGRYKLLQQLGEGGCGVVYLAEQEEPVRRRVALKIIKLGMDTRQV